MYNGITETSSSSSLWCKTPIDHTNHLFKQLGILKLVDLVKFKTSIIMFKAYHNELPDSLQEMFNLHVQIYDTRQKYTFSVHRAHANVKSMCISFYMA